MLKCQIGELLRVYDCLFQDIVNVYPALADEFRKDYETLARLASSRGLALFCVELPAVGKHLDRCVAEAKYTPPGIPLTRRCPRSVMYPEFLKGLWDLVFSQDGCLKEDCDVEALLFLRQIYYLAKKTKAACTDEAVAEEIRDFFVTDAELPTPSGYWEATWPTEEQEDFLGFASSEIYLSRCGDRGDLVKESLTALDIVSGIVASTLGPYQPRDWSFRHGPGAVSERTGSVNKYQFVNWSERLEREFNLADCCFHNYSAWVKHVGGERLVAEDHPLQSCITDIDPCSRLVAVPKTLTKPRLIAAEPSEHMWCQQNIWHYFRSRVRDTFLSKYVRFNDQTLNQELCRLGSLEDKLATLDLSSASDRVSCHFVENLFRSNLGLLRALQSTRTRVVNQTISNESPEQLVLKKFSTMGNACTFPVETLGFLSVAFACIAVIRKQVVTRKFLTSLAGSVAVFGDDIIIPADCCELFKEVLEVLHFKVNTSKSFESGSFRESCGVDAYKGIDITPVYWRDLCDGTPESVASIVDVSNSFHKRGYWHVARYLASTVPMGGIPVVSMDSGVFGFKSFSGREINGLRRRWNSDLQRHELRTRALSASVRRLEIKDDSVLLQFFTEDPSPYQPWAGGVAQRPKVRLPWVWTDINDLGS